MRTASRSRLTSDSFVPDLGTDRVIVYRTGAAGSGSGLAACREIELPAGAGPRHIVFAPDGRHAYLICELAKTVTALSYDSRSGQLDPIQTVSTLQGNICSADADAAEIILHPNGRFVYASNRADDTIAVFARELGPGTVRPVATVHSGGRCPRHMAMVSERWLLVGNQFDGRIVSMAVDAENGVLTPTPYRLHIPGVACIALAR
jgi:6-phosphogluconolactonase